MFNGKIPACNARALPHKLNKRRGNYKWCVWNVYQVDVSRPMSTVYEMPKNIYIYIFIQIQRQFYCLMQFEFIIQGKQYIEPLPACPPYTNIAAYLVILF